jgi:hypothetical protein
MSWSEFVGVFLKCLPAMVLRVLLATPRHGQIQIEDGIEWQ